MSLNYYRHSPGWGTQQLQLGAPPLPGYQPQSSWTGLDFYSAHAVPVGGDPYLYQNTISRMSSGMGGVGKHEARQWHRHAYGGLGEVAHMMPQEIGIAAAYEAYRQIKYNANVYQSDYYQNLYIDSDYERQREAMTALAIAEAQRSWDDTERANCAIDQYGTGRQLACDAAAATASRIATERQMEEGQGYGMGLGARLQNAIPVSGCPASLQDTHERNPGLNGRLLELTGVNSKPRRVPEDDVSEGSTEYHAEFAALHSTSEGEVIRLELEQHLSVSLAAQTERDQRIARLFEANAADAARRAGPEQREHADDRRLMQTLSLVEQRDAELVDMQARLDELRLSHDQQVGQYKKELTNVRAKLEAKESELEAVRLRLTDAEKGHGWAKSKAEADTFRAQTAATGSVNRDEDQITRRLMERVRAIEAEVASKRWNEKSIAEMECRNEG